MLEAGPEHERIATAVVDCAFVVHSILGPGLLESIYEECLTYELRSRGFAVARQVTLPIRYKEVLIGSGLRLDLVVEKIVVVEIKAVETVLPVHGSQLVTYLKLSGLRLGFLLNFNVPLMKNGIRRFVLTEDSALRRRRG